MVTLPLRFAAALLALLAQMCLPVAAAGAEPALRFSREFPLSSSMEERVRFWMRVFTEVSQSDAVLHDRNDPSLVYDVVPAATVDATRATYAHLLNALAIEAVSPMPMFTLPAPERVRVRALFGSRAGPRAYAAAAGNIRAQRGLKEIFTDGLIVAELYLPAIRRIFREAGLPRELTYLPHIESSFNPNARSHAGAAGLWQFTRDTADPLLKVSGGVDERLDPKRSSEAAAKHLARAREVLGSWPLAITAYNHGVAGTARARAAVGSDSLDEIIRGYEGETFGFASENFYAEFLAAAHVAEHAQVYFPGLERQPVLQYVVRSGDSLWKIARKHRVSVRAIVVANQLGRAPLQRGQRLVIRL